MGNYNGEVGGQGCGVLRRPDGGGTVGDESPPTTKKMDESPPSRGRP